MRLSIYFVAICLIWGVTWAAVKIGVEALPPLLLAGLRYALSAVLLAAFVRGAGAAFAAHRAWRTIASALLVVVGTYGLLFWGMQTVPSGIAGLVNMALIPVLLFALATAMGEERPRWLHAGALALGILGLVGLFWSRLGGGDAPVAGLAAIVAGTGCYCLGSVLARPLVGPVKPLTLTMVQSAIGAPILLGLSLLFEPVSLSTWRAVLSPSAIGSLVFLSVAGTLVAYTLYLVLLAEWGTARAGLYTFVSPIVALGIGAWAFDEAIGPAEIAGAVLLLLAAWAALHGSGQSDTRDREASDGGRA